MAVLTVVVPSWRFGSNLRTPPGGAEAEWRVDKRKGGESGILRIWCFGLCEDGDIQGEELVSRVG